MGWLDAAGSRCYDALAMVPDSLTAEYPGGGKPTIVVGVLSDTHLPYRMKRLPDEVLPLFRDADLILHAGDVDRVEYLAKLTALAPFHAVRGNPHFLDLSDGGSELPTEMRLTIAGHNVVVSHGGWDNLWTQANDWMRQKLLRRGRHRLNRRIAGRLARLYPEARVIIFGHTHLAYQAWHNATLFFNPGAVCPTRGQIPSVGRLRLGPDTIEAEVVQLGERVRR